MVRKLGVANRELRLVLWPTPFALLIAVALVAGAAEPAIAEEGFGEPLTLPDVLSRDPRDSPAGCPNVDYGNAAADDASLAVDPNRGGPTRVDVSLFVLAVDRIDPLSNSFHFEGYGGLTWCDPRLAFEPDEAGQEMIRFDEVDELTRRLGAIWWPGIILPTQLGESERSFRRLDVHSDGTVRFTAKVNARMMARYDFRNFPLDTQTLDIVLQVGRSNASDLLIGAAPGQVGLGREFEVPEWKVTGYATAIEAGEQYTRFVMTLEIGRLVGFYWWKIMLPMLIIVCVAWSTFWMTRDALAQRQRQSGTAILTVVAFQFIAAADLPRVAYLTLMDMAVLWTYLCIGSTLLTNIIGNRSYRTSEKESVRSDRLGQRFYFPVYLLGLLVIFLLETVI